MAIQVVTVAFTAEAGPKTATFATPTGNYIKTPGGASADGPVAAYFSAADSSVGGVTTATVSATGAFTGSVTFIVSDSP